MERGRLRLEKSLNDARGTHERAPCFLISQTLDLDNLLLAIEIKQYKSTFIGCCGILYKEV